MGGLGALGLSWPALLRAAPAGAGDPSFGRARRCVLLFLTGGPPQHDTWDPKPDAPAEIRGELKPIATAVPGIRFSELFPCLARRANRLCVVRSVSHDDTVHSSAGYTMLTGVRHPLANSGSSANIRPTPNDHPHVGALLAFNRPPREGVPVFASLPEVIKDNAINEYPGQGPGFLGARRGPFTIQADTRAGKFLPPAIALPDGMTAERLADRRRSWAGSTGPSPRPTGPRRPPPSTRSRNRPGRS
ncbi:MAG: DUF1501 domain-containing protein [Gemmataceae bacterium]|nr:DUF1501 domain-containing protein [Gemmataceae bacterium]